MHDLFLLHTFALQTLWEFSFEMILNAANQSCAAPNYNANIKFF